MPDPITHPQPAWRERADFLIFARIEDSEGRSWEQLWARRIPGHDSTFEICCVPFFVYDLSIGDTVQVEPSDGKKLVLHRVVQQGAYRSFRAWCASAEVADVVEAELRLAAYITERRGPRSRLIAVAAEEDRAEALAGLLAKLESRGDINYEASAS